MNNKLDKLKGVLKNSLADHLGVDSSEINENDSFIEDLHMSITDVTDFVHSFGETSGFDLSQIELNDINTIADFAEALSAKEYFE